MSSVTAGPEPAAAPTAAPAPVAAAAPPASSEVTHVESVPVVEAPVVAEAPKTDAAKPTESSFLGDLLNKDEAKEIAAEPPKAEPVATDLPSFKDWTFPENVKAEDALIKDFNGILGESAKEFGLTQEQAEAFGQRLVDFYVKDQTLAIERAANVQREAWEKYQDGKRSEFRSDEEVGRNRIETTGKRVGAVLDRYASAMGADRAKALRERLVASGMDNDVEMIKFINWNAKFMVETSRPIAAVTPKAQQPTSRSARRYAKSTGAA